MEYRTQDIIAEALPECGMPVRLPQDGYLFSRPFRLLFTLFWISGIINLIFLIFSAVDFIIHAFDIESYREICDFIFSSVASYCMFRIGSGAKQLKNGIPHGGSVITRHMRIYRILIIAGYVYIVIRTCVSVYATQLPLHLLLSPLYVLPLVILIHRLLTGLIPALEQIRLDLSRETGHTYRNHIHVSGLAYLYPGLLFLYALILCIGIPFDLFSYAYGFPVWEPLVFLILCLSIPMFLLGRCHTILKLAHSADSTYESVCLEANARRHSFSSLLGAASVFSFGLFRINDFVSFFYENGASILLIDAVGPLYIACFALEACAFLLFGISLLSRKRNHIMLISALLMIVREGYMLFYSYEPGCLSIADLSETANLISVFLRLVFFVSLAFYAAYTLKHKQTLPGYTRIILYGMVILFIVFNLLPTVSLLSTYLAKDISISGQMIFLTYSLFRIASLIFLSVHSGYYES